MNAVFLCPRCNKPLGTPDEPKPEPLPACAGCGWRASDLELDPDPPAPNRWRWFWFPLLFLGGVVGGAVIGHSMLLFPVAFLGVGVGGAVKIARTFNDGWWLVMLTYCAGLFFGLLRFHDTFLATRWQEALWIAGASAFCGLVAGLFRWRD